jgi:hypothetical protein
MLGRTILAKRGEVVHPRCGQAATGRSVSQPLAVCNLATDRLVGASKKPRSISPKHPDFSFPMSPRKKILRELSEARQGPGESGSFKRPAAITGFAEQPEKYQKAVNELLQSRLVEGRKDDEGHMTIALNEHRIQDVRKELRPIWARPALWALIVIAVVAVGAIAV